MASSELLAYIAEISARDEPTRVLELVDLIGRIGFQCELTKGKEDIYTLTNGPVLLTPPGELAQGSHADYVEAMALPNDKETVSPAFARMFVARLEALVYAWIAQETRHD